MSTTERRATGRGACLLRRNLAVAVALTSVWLIADLIDVKVARLPSFPYEIQIILAVAFVAFVIAGRSAWPNLSFPYRWVAVAGMASVLAFAWFSITVAILLQFHLLIGGNL